MNKMAFALTFVMLFGGFIWRAHYRQHRCGIFAKRAVCQESGFRVFPILRRCK